MAPRDPKKLAKKTAYLDRVKDLLDTCEKILIASVDHVGSNQLQQIRIGLRGKAIIVMGKNTMLRTALRQYEEEHDADLGHLLNVIKGNIGLIFCMAPIDEIREIISQHKVPAMAKAGMVAQCNVDIPAGPTSLDPSQTNFFQALNIATKIVKGSIEISNDVALVTKGSKVTASQQALLMKLNIRPFEYGVELESIYDNGEVYDAAALDISDDDLVEKFMHGVTYFAAFSREAGIPNEATLPYAINNAFRNIAALCSDIDFTFPEIEELKEFLKDPSKFASAAPAAGAAAAGEAKAEAAAAPAEEEEEEDEEMDFDLFD
ncbi:ribosomal P protein, putative [Perkinsus marinus ATCC 50983]|uniref:60S acidic ribosomal protein P0 n=1 Tax=Perkinsus marinus (strain ATCC 50983 / TXsc) TaxID=423536 RepID=C5LYE6_PERM5|nr:ribosomal P protein, putative [Perkinsus marinus ATCC 50983]EEQ98184.1 ribosomal P protein, putative [Perkinsus marinus ATCC 50983]|eukprot:XP_002765467.1 ribosomal P protein, putative [Perkinsus marinus ATCC 50983]